LDLLFAVLLFAFKYFRNLIPANSEGNLYFAIAESKNPAVSLYFGDGYYYLLSLLIHIFGAGTGTEKWFGLKIEYGKCRIGWQTFDACEFNIQLL
jgi:hypothetical protein